MDNNPRKSAGEMRAMAVLLKAGWKPKRTIIYCAWYGEEPGLLGSTEWAETHADDLQKNAVAYINSDSNGRGFLKAAGSHTLESFINSVMKDIDRRWKPIEVPLIARSYVSLLAAVVIFLGLFWDPLAEASYTQGVGNFVRTPTHAQVIAAKGGH